MSRKVYIDLGANVGETLKSFLDEHPDAICYAFEPNIALHPRIASVGLEYNKPIYMIWGAAWIENGTINLFQSSRPAASTVVSGKVEYEERGWPAIDYQKGTPVPCIDFSAWLLNSFHPTDTIYVKMDIEGAEYAVLTKMIFDGSLQMVSHLKCEWHFDRYPHISKAEHDLVREKTAEITSLTDWR